MHEKPRDDEKKLGIINGQIFRKLFIFWKHFNEELRAFAILLYYNPL